MAILEIEGLTAGYGSGPDILTGVDVEVEEGKTYCIIGPNGAGKTTTFNAIAGLNIPTGIPLVYRLDQNMRPLERGGQYLDPDAAADAIKAVAAQGR